MKQIDVIIIGTGPAGLMAGANIKSKSTLILDKSKNPSAKLIITGNGKCNFTHAGDIDFISSQYNGHKNFIKNAFKRFFYKDSCDFFKSHGVDYIETENKTIYPKSLDAKDIRKALLDANEDNGHKINLEECVKDIIRIEDKFQIITDKNVYLAKNVVCAVGGKAYPHTGSDGELFKVFEKLGHSIIPLRPALSSIFIKNDDLKTLQGVSFENSTISAYRNNKIIAKYSGKLLITHFGISAQTVLNMSRHVDSNDIIKIQFGEFSKHELSNYLIDESNKNGKKQIASVLREELYPKSLVQFILNKIGVPLDCKLSELSKKSRMSVVEGFCEYKIVVDYVGDKNISMATNGGIDIDEINRKNMMSKLIPNLYFVGECMDIDGNTGGYNIQWAFTSGYIAGKNIEECNTK